MDVSKLKCVKDLAEFLSVNRSTVHLMLKRKKYPTYWIGRRKFYNPDDFIEYGK